MSPTTLWLAGCLLARLVIIPRNKAKREIGNAFIGISLGKYEMDSAFNNKASSAKEKGP